MANEQAFFNAFVYLAAALVAVLIGKRLGLGAVLGYLAAGAAIGPWGLHLVGDGSEKVMHFAEFGVVMMLFLVGLELQPGMLWKMRRAIAGLGSLQVILSAAAIGGCAWLLGLDWRAATAAGLILAMSSTAIVLQSLTERGLLHTEAGQNSFAVLLFQDLAVIPIMAVLPLLAHQAMEPAAVHGSSAWMSSWPGWAQAVVTVSAVLAVIVIGRIAIRPFFRAIAATRQREAFTAAALLLVIGVDLLMTRVGLSPALGAFVAGVGMGIDFNHIVAHLGLALGLTAALLAIKGTLLFSLAKFHGSPNSGAITFAAALSSGGEFAFVLLGIAAGNSVIDPDTLRTLIAVVALSMACTPLLIMASQRLPRGGEQAPTDDRMDVEDEGSPVIICGFGRFGHTVGRLLRTQGFACTILDHDPDQVELLRSIGIPVFYGDAARPDLLMSAGGATAKILVVALKDAGTTLRIVETARRHFPHLRIYLRAHSRLEAYEFLGAGEEQIYRDTLDSSLTMSGDVLLALGVSPLAARRVTKLYRKQDEAMVRRMAAHRHDREAFMNSARESVKTLDELMRNNALPKAKGDIH